MKVNIKNILLLTVIFVFMNILCGCQKTVNIKSVSDLSGMRIGVQAETTGEDLLMSHDEIHNAKISSYYNCYSAVADLMNGELDAVVIDYVPASKLAAKYSNITIVSDKFPIEEYAIAVKKGNTELLKLINDGIDEIRKNGEYDDLIETFMPANGIIHLPEKVTFTSNDTLTIGTNAAFSPFEYHDTDGSVVGFDICIMQKIALMNNKTLVIVDMPFGSLLNAVQQGTVDCVIAGMSVTEERQKFVDFSKPYFSSHQVIIVKK
ncbi:MAG: transporter substrate-binding domain-containing protein [Spirochaetales bacterium]|nr:transporter substrate-binding domain-containing protein [Spirochaetales bacterium]